eukprot:7357793-Alexandrium_andersonii.AAC.1
MPEKRSKVLKHQLTPPLQGGSRRAGGASRRGPGGRQTGRPRGTKLKGQNTQAADFCLRLLRTA